MGWEEGDPAALEDASPRLDLTSKQGWDGDPLGKAVSVPHVLCIGEDGSHPSSHLGRGMQGADGMTCGCCSSLAWQHV